MAKLAGPYLKSYTCALKGMVLLYVFGTQLVAFVIVVVFCFEPLIVSFMFWYKKMKYCNKTHCCLSTDPINSMLCDFKRCTVCRALKYIVHCEKHLLDHLTALFCSCYLCANANLLISYAIAR